MKPIDYDKIYKKEWASCDNEEFLGTRKKIALDLFPKNNEKNLDVGCGTGDFMKIVSKKKEVHIEGIDISEEAIKKAKESKLEVKKSDCINTGYKEESFRVITALDVLEHVKDHKKAIKEWHRILKNKGVLIICVPYKKTLWRKDDILVGHFRRYELDDLTDLFGNLFKIEKKVYSGFPFYIMFREINLRFMEKNNLTTGCFARKMSKQKKIFRTIIKILMKIELIFKKIPIGTSIILRVKKI